MSVLLLAGSPSIPSRSTRLLHYVGEQLASRGHRTSKLHVLDLPPEALLHADFNNSDIKLARSRVAQSQAIVIATPVYKAAYSGILKTFLDLLPQDGFAGKLVLPLATGGSQSHMLALDYALRPVLSALGSHQVFASIYATDTQVVWTSENGLNLDPAILARVDDGVKQFDAALSALGNANDIVESHSSIPFSQVRCSV